MATLKVPYETADTPGAYLALEVPDENLAFCLNPQEPKPLENLIDAVKKAIESPGSGVRFSELLHSGKRVAFIIENQFRAAPVRDILPVLIAEARKAGCEISLIIGTGTLPPLSAVELEKKIGPALAQSGLPIYFNEVDNADEYCYLGITRVGTPLFVHKAVAEADVILTVSTTQPTIWGYGGSGMIIPAVAARETIEINHLLSLAPDCIPGNNDCFMQLDKYEGLKMARVQMAINVIVNNQRQVAFVNAGSPVESHREAVDFFKKFYEFRIEGLGERKVDIAIAGSNPFTDDLFFHTGWAIANCAPVVRDGGIIILATQCTGYGHWPGFVRMEVLRNYLPPSNTNRIRALKDFYRQIVSGSRSFAWYKIYEVMTRKEVFIVTHGNNLAFCREVGLHAYGSIEEAYASAVERCGWNARIAFIPNARYTVIRGTE